MNKEIIKLKDDSVINIITDHDYTRGCPTCDYGSDYCTTVTIYFKNHNPILFEKHKMYDYDEYFSVGFFIKFFCSNYEKFLEMTVNEFIDFITTEIKKDFEDVIKIP